MSEDEPPPKRLRQACDPCRVKKSKCPGEQPTCSQCHRLRQQCTYNGIIITRTGSRRNGVPKPTSQVESPTTPVHVLEPAVQSDALERLQNVETQLATVLATLRPPDGRSRTASEQTPTPTIRNQTQRVSPAIPRLSLDPERLSRNEMRHVAKLYLTYCNNQPLPMFNQATLLESLDTRSDELLFSIFALAARFEAQTLTQVGYVSNAMRYANAAGVSIMQRMFSGDVDLSTLQSLCLLSLFEFNHGNTHQSSIYSSLAMDISQTAGLANACLTQPANALQEEQLRCFWSVVLLKRLHGNLSGAFCLSINEKAVPIYPQSSSRPSFMQGGIMERISSASPTSDHPDLGIVAYAIQLTEVWQSAAHYAHRRRTPGSHPPWSSESEYARILARQMECETWMPYSQHRFKPARFAERSAEELTKHRDYWAPWLFNQMMYHAIICLLNHPLLLSLRLRQFKVASVPEIWLQHTDDLVASHTQWMIHLIDLIESKQFEVSDPFLAHCAAIVATIYLQQSFGEDQEIQSIKKENYVNCLNFCEKLGRRWPLVNTLYQKVRKFESMVSRSYDRSSNERARDKIYLDLTVFWEILESSLVSESADERGLRLGISLKCQQRINATTDEFDAQLLPEPSRLTTATNTPAASHEDLHTAGLSMQQVPVFDTSSALNDDYTVLAQSYFAQGQDFVGSLDDWWSLG